MALQRDSVDKIIERYFACLTRESFTYKGKTFEPKTLKVSPLLLRGYTCPAGCGGCCGRFSLDYLPSEDLPPGTRPRIVLFNDEEFIIQTDMQDYHDDPRCRHLTRDDGRCGIYLRRPFSCDFELIRTLEFESGPNVLTQKLFGRGWSYKRVDGEKGALCEMTPPSQSSISDVVRKLKRFQQWSDHFGIKTWAPVIIQLIEKNRLVRQVVLEDQKEPLLF